MRPGHYTVRLTFTNGGFLRFTYKSTKPFNQSSFISGDDLMDGDQPAIDSDGFISLTLGPRGIYYDPGQVISVDMYPAKSDPSHDHEDEHGVVRQAKPVVSTCRR